MNIKLFCSLLFYCCCLCMEYGLSNDLLVCAVGSNVYGAPVKIAKFKDIAEHRLILSKDDIRSREIYLLRPRKHRLVKAYEVTFMLTNIDPWLLFHSCAPLFNDIEIEATFLFAKYDTVTRAFTIRTLLPDTYFQVLQHLTLSLADAAIMSMPSVAILDGFNPEAEDFLKSQLHFVSKPSSPTSPVTLFKSYALPFSAHLFLENVNFESFVEDCRIVVSYEDFVEVDPADCFQLQIDLCPPNNHDLGVVRKLFFQTIQTLLKTLFSGRQYLGESFFPGLELLKEIRMEPSGRQKYDNVSGESSTIYRLKLSIQKEIGEETLRVLQSHIKGLIMAGTFPTQHALTIKPISSVCYIEGDPVDEDAANVSFNMSGSKELLRLPVNGTGDFILMLPYILNPAQLDRAMKSGIKIENTEADREGMMIMISSEVTCTDRRRMTLGLLRLYELVARFYLGLPISTIVFRPMGKCLFSIIVTAHGGNKSALIDLLPRLHGILGLIFRGLEMEVRNMVFGEKLSDEASVAQCKEKITQADFKYSYWDEVVIPKAINPAQKKKSNAASNSSGSTRPSKKELIKREAARLKQVRREEAIAARKKKEDDDVKILPAAAPKTPASDVPESAPVIPEESILTGRATISIMINDRLVEFDIPVTSSSSSSQ